jgi:hypothetical protein
VFIISAQRFVLGTKKAIELGKTNKTMIALQQV